MFWPFKKSKSHLAEPDNKKRYSFVVNQNLKLILKKSETKYELQSVIQDVLEDRIRILSLSPRYLSLISDPKTTIEVVIYHDDGVYSFESSYLGLVEDGVPMYELAKPSQIRKSQRRDYQRLKIDWPIAYEISAELYARYPYLMRKGVMQSEDLSASGIRLVAKQDLPADLDLNLDFILGTKSQRPIRLKAKLIACEKDSLSYRYLCRFVFCDIEDSLRIMIDDYVRENI